MTRGAHEECSWRPLDTYGALTLYGGTSQNAYSSEPQLPTGPSSTIPWDPIPSSTDSELGLVHTPFTRCYSRYDSCCLFLGLMICLSSARHPAHQRLLEKSLKGGTIDQLLFAVLFVEERSLIKNDNEEPTTR